MTQKYSEGIKYILIKGKIVLEKGNYNSKALVGRVLRKL